MGAEVISEMGGFAAATIMGQAARAFTRRRYFNVVVTNVPGPQNPLYLLGRELDDCFPMVPLARNQGLGVAILSYNGRLNFGLVGDYDVMFDLEDLAEDVLLSLEELAEAARRTASPPHWLNAKRGYDSFVRDKVIESARRLGLEVDVRNLDSSTATVGEAAQAVGCEDAQIAKSLVFVCDGDPVVCIASGAHRVDTDLLADVFDCAEVRQASPDEVRAATGYSVGGVAPFGHDLPTVMDEDLLAARLRLGRRGRRPQPVRGQPPQAAELHRRTAGAGLLALALLAPAPAAAAPSRAGEHARRAGVREGPRGRELARGDRLARAPARARDPGAPTWRPARSRR